MSFLRICERVGLLSCALALAFACSFDRGDRWLASAPSVDAAVTCTVGAERCTLSLERCTPGDAGPAWQVVEDCASEGLVCVPSLLACRVCAPNATRCTGSDVEACAADGSGYAVQATCTGVGIGCRNGGCVDLCGEAAVQRSNVGCEYWAADLDNANVNDTANAAAQQFAVVVSNPQPDMAATVTISQDDGAPGQPSIPTDIATAVVPPFSLRVFRLGPREVDGSPPGTFDTGTGSALTRAAYRIRADVPVVAYQFNPLENVNVFSNDASLLKPLQSLGDDSTSVEPKYVVLGWPQTIATTDDPNTNFGGMDLRAFLTILGARGGTHVRVHTTARILGGGGIPATHAGGTVELELGPFDVANLETDDFNADFTGSVIESDRPVVVFSGSEASDAPFFDSLSVRQCCADHLEEQLDPIRTAGKRFVASVSANRIDVITRAGATGLEPAPTPEYFRVIAATERGARVRTTLPPPLDSLTLPAMGSFADITSTRDFLVDSDEPIHLGSVSASQEATGIPRTLPGGDPSLLLIPPIEQYRSTYVFLTPDLYSFDFLRIVSPAGADVRLDGAPLGVLPACVAEALPDPFRGGSYTVHRCQLGFPVIDMTPGSTQLLSTGVQNDGVHEVIANAPVGVLVDGFDKNVSYAYAAGTELTEIVLR